MTSHPPPTSYSSIFNPLSYTIEDGFLTLAEADNRYFKRTGGVVSGLATFNAGLYSTAQINITANTDSTSTITGSLITAGGIGIAKTLYVGNGIENFDGTVTNPAYSFANNTNTGIYRIGVNNLGITCNGINQIDISTSLTTFTNPLRLPDGGWTFSSSTNTGFSYTGANRILVSNAGSQSWVFSNGGINQSNLPVSLPTNNAATPSLRCKDTGITTTGLFFKTTPSLCVTTGGTERLDISSNGSNFSNQIQGKTGAVNDPSFSWFAEQNSGMYRAAANDLRFSVAGVSKFRWTSTANVSEQQLDMNSNNIINCPKVTNTTGNFELAVNSTGAGGTITLTGGTDLLQGTAGGSSGQHLKLIINGTAYKIALLNN